MRRPLRFSWKAGSLLIVLGLLIGIAVAVSAIVDVRQMNSPFDQVDSSSQSGMGFDPILIPEGESTALQNSQNSALQTSELTGNTPASTVVGGYSSSQSATSLPVWIPDRIVIPAIKLDAPVKIAIKRDIEYEGKAYQQWSAPNLFAAGLITTSATLGVPGNTVLVGHNNVAGDVFGHLVDLKIGDLILVYSGNKKFAYEITLRMILPERFQTIEIRLKNAQWVAPTQDERLTLVTCWPYKSNTHRLILVAMPVSLESIDSTVVIPRTTPFPTGQPSQTPAIPSP